MGIPRKGSRQAELGDDVYLWRVKKTTAPDASERRRGLYFVLMVQRSVEHFTRPGSVALFHLESRSPWFKMLPNFGSKPGTNVSSSDVRELIEFALNQGWDPEAQGPFRVAATEAPDFVKFNLASAA